MLEVLTELLEATRDEARSVESDAYRRCADRLADHPALAHTVSFTASETSLDEAVDVWIDGGSVAAVLHEILYLPMLLLSGRFDPITPPDSERAQIGASPSRPDGVSPALVRCAHGPLGPRPRSFQGVRAAYPLGLTVDDFVTDPDSPVAVSCADEQRPPVWIPVG